MMRIGLLAAVAGGVLLTLGACEREVEERAATQQQAVVETPKRKAGLWKQTMFIDEIGAMQTANVCLDEDADAKMAWWAQQGIRVGCSKNDVSRRPDGSWAFSSVCDLAGGIRMTTNGQAVGDFQSKYQVKAETTTTGAPMAQMNGTRTTTIDATWMGECPAGMQPGEMELPDGRRINMLAMGDAPAAPTAP